MKTNTSFSFPSLLLLLSFVCALSPVNGWQIESLSASVILLFGWAYAMLSRDAEKGWALPTSPVLIFGGLFWLLVIASSFWSQIKPLSLMGVCFFSMLPLTFFASVLAGQNVHLKKIAAGMAVIFAVLSIWAVFQFFFLNAYVQGHAAHPLADPASLGALFSLALFCALGRAVSDCSAKERNIAVALSILLVFGLLSTASLEPMSAFVPAILCFAVLLWPQIKLHKKSVLLIVLGGVVFFGVSLTNVQKTYDLEGRLFGDIPAKAEKTGENRLSIWPATQDMIMDHPLLGTGIGTFSQYYPEYRRDKDTTGTSTAKNDPLQFWAELGILGPFLFYAFIGAATLRTSRALKLVSKDNQGSRIVIASLFSGFVALAAQSHVSSVFYTPSLLMVTGLMMSVWFLETGRVLKEVTPVSAVQVKSPSAMKIALALPFLVAGWLLLSVTGGEHLVNKADSELAREDMGAFANHINMADKVAQGMNYRVYLSAVNVPFAILIDRKDRLNNIAQTNLYNQIVDYMGRVIAINPREPSAYFYLAKVQTMVSADVVPKEALKREDLYKKALELNPMMVDARIALFDLYKAEGKSNDELLAVMEPGAYYNYTVPLAAAYYGELARLYLESARVDKVTEFILLGNKFKKRFDSVPQKKEPSSQPVTEEKTPVPTP